MCHVLITTDKTFKDTAGKKKFQNEQRLEVMKVIPHPIILFVFTGTKNAEKTIRRFKKEHPKAIEWQSGLKKV